MSGFYIGVDGKARKIKGGYIGIDGKARKIKKGYIGVNGVARLCWAAADPVLANNTWEEIAAACQSGSVPDTWKVGDQKTMTIGSTEYVFDIIGKNHDDYADGSGKAPLTFQLHDCFGVKYELDTSGTSKNGWVNTTMRKTHLPAVFQLMPVEVQSAIKEVSKLTSEGNNASGKITTADKLFLLSEVEVIGQVRNSVAGEGTQYAYYVDPTGAATWASAKAAKLFNNAKESWYTRSPVKSTSGQYCYVTNNGGMSTLNPTYELGVSFAFCF